MTEIYVDHVALVAEGRAGPDVRVSDERLNNTMPKLNDTGLKLTTALANLLGKTGINRSDVEDAVVIASGTRRKNLGKILQAILSNNMTTADCDCVKDDQIDAAVDRVMDDGEDYIGDEEPVDTVSTEDEDMPDFDAADCHLMGKRIPNKRVQAFDAASLERSIEKKLKAKSKQAQEARQLVKPLVGEWAITEDEGEEILRSVLMEITGETPPTSMGYSGLKYAVDLVLSHKSQGRAGDSKRMQKGDLQRFGATRLRSI